MRPRLSVGSAPPTRIGARLASSASTYVPMRQLGLRHLRREELLPPPPLLVFPQMLTLPAQSRSMGIHIMAGRGSGKSRLMGRGIAYHDIWSGIPLVNFDPMGSTIDNILDKFNRLDPERRRQLRIDDRILYVDMAGRGSTTVPFPIYYKLAQESLYDVASRFPTVVASLDSSLLSAPILGLNALKKASTHLGMLLMAMGCQLTEAVSMLHEPNAWMGHVTEVARRRPELAASAAFYDSLRRMRPGERELIISSLETKLLSLVLDPRQVAMFGACSPGIDWEDVVGNQRIVLLDFRNEHNVEIRRFKMLWAFSCLMEYVKYRGRGRHQPISIIIDELTELLDIGGTEDSPFEKELNSLVNVYARNCSLWLTICHQEAFQVRPYTYKTLMGMGTQILGATADMAAALQVAADMFCLDPHRLKALETVWGSQSRPDYVYDRAEGKDRLIMQSEPTPIDSRAVYYTLDEQSHMNASGFMNLGLFEFYVKVASGEGQMSRAVHPVNIRNLDKGIWVDEAAVESWRDRLRSSTGRPVDEILEEIRQRGFGSPVASGSTHDAQQGDAPRPEEDAGSVDLHDWDVGPL